MNDSEKNTDTNANASPGTDELEYVGFWARSTRASTTSSRTPSSCALSTAVHRRCDSPARRNRSGNRGRRMYRSTTILWLVLAAVLPMGGSARADVTVEVVDTDPAGDVVWLGRNQSYYLRLSYQSDEPVKIWARPYYRGEVVKAGSNPSRVHPAGSGEALGWFFLFEPGTRVDEVRISAGDGSLDGTPVVAVHRVQVIGTGEAASRSESSGQTPAWVDEQRALDKAALEAFDEQQRNTPISRADRLFATGFMLATLAVFVLGFVAPAWGLWRWRGGWRIAAAVPAAMMAFVVLRILVGVAIDPTSHNLWPFEILMTGGVCSGIMLVLVAARKLGGVRQET